MPGGRTHGAQHTKEQQAGPAREDENKQDLEQETGAHKQRRMVAGPDAGRRRGSEPGTEAPRQPRLREPTVRQPTRLQTGLRTRVRLRPDQQQPPRRQLGPTRQKGTDAAGVRKTGSTGKVVRRRRVVPKTRERERKRKRTKRAAGQDKTRQEASRRTNPRQRKGPMVREERRLVVGTVGKRGRTKERQKAHGRTGKARKGGTRKTHGVDPGRAGTRKGRKRDQAKGKKTVDPRQRDGPRVPQLAAQENGNRRRQQKDRRV